MQMQLNNYDASNFIATSDLHQYLHASTFFHNAAMLVLHAQGTKTLHGIHWDSYSSIQPLNLSSPLPPLPPSLLLHQAGQCGSSRSRSSQRLNSREWKPTRPAQTASPALCVG